MHEQKPPEEEQLTSRREGWLARTRRELGKFGTAAASVALASYSLSLLTLTYLAPQTADEIDSGTINGTLTHPEITHLHAVEGTLNWSGVGFAVLCVASLATMSGIYGWRRSHNRILPPPGEQPDNH